jgi:hypothetical protein
MTSAGVRPWRADFDSACGHEQFRWSFGGLADQRLCTSSPVLPVPCGHAARVAECDGWRAQEIKAGPHVLELYKKPTDLKRKKLSLLTVKPLYLHITVDLVKA